MESWTSSSRSARIHKIRQYNEVRINDEIFATLIQKHAQFQFMKMIYRSMIVPPVPHTLEQAGGVLTMERRKPTVGGLSKISETHLESLNILQTTEWKINEECWK